DALNAEIDLPGSLLRSHRSCQALNNFRAPQGEILCAVIQHLGAVVCGGLRPSCSFARCFHRVANVFSIPQRGFAEQLSIGRAHFHAIAGIWTRLFAADIKFDRAVDSRCAGLGLRWFEWSRSGAGTQLRSMLQPLRFQVFEQAFSSAFATVAALAISTEAAGGVEHVRAVYPDHSRFDLRRHMKSHVDALTPNARSESVHGVVGQFDSFIRS